MDIHFEVLLNNSFLKIGLDDGKGNLNRNRGIKHVQRHAILADIFKIWTNTDK